MIEYSVVKNSKELFNAFTSCSEVFGKEEIDPYEWWHDEFAQTIQGTHNAPYYCLICKDNQKIIGGITWNMFKHEEMYFPAIGFLWVKNSDKYRNKGIGTTIYLEAEKIIFSLFSYQKIGFYILESNIANDTYGIKSSVGFWEKQGFCTIPKINYFLPCLEYDSMTGKQLLPDIKLAVMIKKINFEKNQFLKVIDNMYTDWYEPNQAEFANNNAYQKAYNHFSTLRNQINISIDDV